MYFSKIPQMVGTDGCSMLEDHLTIDSSNLTRRDSTFIEEMPSQMTDVNAVWGALRNETSGSVFPDHIYGNSIVTLVQKSRCGKKKGSSKQRKRTKCTGKHIRSAEQKEATDAENNILSPKVNMVGDSDSGEEQEPTQVNAIADSILSWSNEAIPSSGPLLEDSDDELPDEIHSSEIDSILTGSGPDIKRSWRAGRIASALQNDETRERLVALEALLKTVSHLLASQPQLAPALKFPPPYDSKRITLSHKPQGAVVSDMANGEYVSQWTQWQRTHAPLASQFLKERIKDKGTTDKDDSEGTTHEDETSCVRRQLTTILNSCGCAIFRRFSDKSERCREIAMQCMQSFCLAQLDMGKHIAYLMPAILSRYPPAFFDDEMQVFVHNQNNHEHHKRGGATERQDRDGLLSSAVFVEVIETSEEVRVELCELMSALIRGAVASQATGPLDAYFCDIILALQSHLRDPFPVLKVKASVLLVQILRIPEWEQGAKYFATGLARVSIPNMRHRNSKVRVAAIDLFEAAVAVPNREKIKGAGSEAIVDVVGFREENVSHARI